MHQVLRIVSVRTAYSSYRPPNIQRAKRTFASPSTYQLEPGFPTAPLECHLWPETNSPDGVFRSDYLLDNTQQKNRYVLQFLRAT